MARQQRKSSVPAPRARPVQNPTPVDVARIEPASIETVRIEPVRIEVLRLPHALGLPLPQAQTTGSAGIDLIAAVDPYGPIHLAPGKRVLIPTGLVIAIPPGYEGQVRPRSGLALKHGVTVLNSPGTIDSDYRGEVKVILINHGDAPFAIERGERIAQLVVAAVAQAELVEVAEITPTDRAAGGFGSTGKS